MTKEKKFFVTTPIYYINDVPHIGHAYASFAADILTRYHRLKGEKTFLLTGSDENSQKTVEAAAKKGLTAERYATEMASVWQKTWEKLGVGEGGDFGFVRTTSPVHEKFVQEVFQKIYDAGFLEKGVYRGLYCVGHEAFIRAEDLDQAGLCPDHKTKPETLEEKNYFFKLADFEKKLTDFYAKNPEFIEPEERKNEVFSFVRSGLENISVSREKAKWGIKVPFDESQRTYVWFDALLSYYSGTPEEFWPADVHIIGKDILRFHAVIWPAMLMAADLPLPKKVFAHGFFTINGQKISKSLGNAVDPLKIAEEYGVDALRYFLFKEFPFGNDGDFSFERLKEVYNADLANGLGNLVARVAKLAETLGLEIEGPREKPLFDSTFAVRLDNLEFQQALEYIWDKIRAADKKIEETKPWELVKTNRSEAEEVVSNLVRQILEIQELLLPFLPETSSKMSAQFAGPKIKAASPLFPRK
ncbi:MAG: methionine--tRNA ligase [Candidatus Woykebacteria bacterium RIFCSPHIGHO2_12_FULL_45_10]|uniref:Methionine--tRNA ligase n=1 Tax=Candidatus Woykebacteria bacterium RIFCSPHIGHO2_12_FULL_45_10 TaxID=1802603 RepID=A0A1G1WNG8_9BACT|nr:MAG: methionine--tRNA ligase [Candidatus Woykebacteria bacterium RIFCSPHIGHO2_12_FULL_45_10]